MAADGARIRLHFKYAYGGLMAKNAAGLKVNGFEIAGADRKFVLAEAEIDGETIVVHSEKVNQPVAVRYAWGMNPSCNLYNRAGLPASPFRTDDWENSVPEM
jgi:sialate O-acetylesterase